MKNNVLNEFKKSNIKVLFEKEDVYPYAFDTGPNAEHITPPYCVTFPKNTQDVVKIVNTARINDLNVVPRGAGTCHCSGCKTNSKSIVIHFSLMDKIIEINKEDMYAKVEPYVAVGKLQKEVEKLGLFFPPDPSNLAVSTVGGAVALSAGGPRTFKYGTTKDYVINLKVVLASGEIMETAIDIAKNVTGYNLTQLFVGSEGTLGIITEITFKLIPKPEKSLVTLAYFDSIIEAAQAVNNIINSYIVPSALDLLDQNTLSTIEKFNPCGLITDKQAALLIEIDGSQAKILQDQQKIHGILLKSNAHKIVQATDEKENEKIWKARRGSFACAAKLRPNVVTEDIVVKKSKIAELIKGIQDICEEHNIIVCIMGHVGDGNIHPNFVLDLSNPIEKENFDIVKDKLFKLAIELGGTLSGEHGIGSEKKKYLPMAIDPVALKYMEKIKDLFDPNHIINPDKIF